MAETPFVVFELDDEGPLLGSESDALDLVVAGDTADADWIAVPTTRLHPDFFRLLTGMAGAFTQKLVNYRARLVVLGDIAEQVAASSALADYVRESNYGSSVWFLPNRAALQARLDEAALRRAKDS